MPGRTRYHHRGSQTLAEFPGTAPSDEVKVPVRAVNRPRLRVDGKFLTANQPDHDASGVLRGASPGPVQFVQIARVHAEIPRCHLADPEGQ